MHRVVSDPVDLRGLVRERPPPADERPQRAIQDWPPRAAEPTLKLTDPPDQTRFLPSSRGYSNAMGLPGEPVPPTIGNGAKTYTKLKALRSTSPSKVIPSCK